MLKGINLAAVCEANNILECLHKSSIGCKNKKTYRMNLNILDLNPGPDFKPQEKYSAPGTYGL